MTSTLIPTDEIEELAQSGLPHRALERHIDAADASIIDLYGAHTGERTIALRGDHSLPRRPYWQRSGYGSSYGRGGNGYGIGYDGGGEYRLHLPYPWALTVAEIKEYEDRKDADDAEVVDADDWELESDGRIVRRLDRPWRDYVIVRYTPIDDTSKRVLLLADLVKLSTVYDATNRTAVGPGGAGVSVQHLDYESERKKLLHRLMPNRPGSVMA